jgi:hypothetical protein
MAQFFQNPQPPRNPMYDQPEGVINPGQVMQAAPNTIRNNTTGMETALPSSGGQGMNSAAFDYSSPIEIPGVGKGYRLKGDATRAVMADGRIIDMGRDTGAERTRMKEDLEFQKKRAELEKLQRDATHGKRTSTMSVEARLGYELKNGLIDQATYDTAMAGTQGGKAAAAKAIATEKATAKSVVAQEKAAVDYKTQTGRLDEMLGEIDKLIDEKGNAKDELKSYAGPFDQLTPVILPTASRGQSALETLRNKLTIKNLAEAKKEADQSFGAMAVKEWPRFENMHAYLDPSINDKVLGENLLEYRTKLIKAKNDITNAYQSKAGGTQSAAPTQAAQTAPAAVDRGAVVMQGGVQYPVVSRNPDGSAIIRDPRTGKTGVWRP